MLKQEKVSLSHLLTAAKVHPASILQKSITGRYIILTTLNPTFI